MTLHSPIPDCFAITGRTLPNDTIEDKERGQICQIFLTIIC